MSSSPAILQIIPALDAGGAERTTVDIAQALARDGLVALVASEGGRLEPQLAAVGGELIRLPAAAKAPPTMIANAIRLAKIIRARNVKLVHARSRAPAWSALLAARAERVPFVTTYHGIYNASNALKRFYNSVMVRGDAVIANSQWTAAHVAAEYRVYYRKVAGDNPKQYTMDHSSVIYLMGPDGKMVSFYDEAVSPDELAKDLRAKV